ncbi:hypothetical protein NS220_15970 [Microbacterium testaceum]|uniref:Fibronectin type-III domain-containing protein n=1 Tax=Microbacterium testaceum TaxID=2033 RepID=A0A147ETB7_MICTE|nr:fibronectin type III domain-containing protein [Microbacterium testaceum]KTR89240.1 hypothetical protein NS220_15970 [Microbacterium testaceum]
MAFDARAYRDAVLKKHSRGEDYEQLRDVMAALQRDPSSTAYAALDLNTLFGIDHPTTAAQLADWDARIVPALNKAATLPAAKLLRDLLHALKNQGEDVTDPAFWGRLAARRADLVIERLEGGIRQLRAEYPLGVVTIADLTSRLSTLGITGVTEASLVAVAQNEGLGVFEPPTLPGAVPAALRPIWQQLRKHAAYRTVLDVILLHRPEDVRDVDVLDTLAVAGSDLTADEVSRARRKSEQGQDTDALQDAQKFLGALIDACTKDPSVLHETVLSTLAESVSVQLSRGKPHLAIRDELVASGIRDGDASRLVSALARSAQAAPPSVGLDEVRDLIRRAQLSEAERTLASVDPGEDDHRREHEALVAQVAHLKDRKRIAIEEYRSALAGRDFATALRAVQDALTLDESDPALAGLREALPPEVPHSFRGVATAAGVELTWAPSSDDGVAYAVVRRNGRVPATPTDGHVVVARTTDPSTRDAEVSNGETFTYAVFATRDGRVYSDAAAVTLTLLPEPGDLTARTDPTAAHLSWATPPGASSAVVTRIDADGSRTVTEVSHGSSFGASGLVPGATYRFTVQAVYLLASGRELSTPASISVVPRGVATAVRDMIVQPSAGSDGALLVAAWSRVPGFVVDLWSFPRATELAEGTLVDLAELPRLGGTRVPLLPGSADGEARFATPSDITRVIPVTVTDARAVVGRSVIAGRAPLPTQVTAERFGADLRVSWDWPEGDGLVELSWREGGQARSRRFTRARYRSEGGAKLGNAAQISGLTIAPVVRIDDEEWVSEPVAVDVGSTDSTPAARYSVRLRKSLLGKTTAHVEVHSSRPGGTITAAVVVKQGAVMPFGLDDGERVAQLECAFAGDEPVTHQVELGKRGSPFWVCLFPLDDAVELIPPPTSEMKG